MGINKEIVKNLLDGIKEAIALIDSMEISRDVLLEDIDIQHLIERRLHIAVESAIDVACHIAAAMSLPGRETAKDVFELLGSHKIITKDLSEKMQKAVGFRNILIHEYGKIDYERLFRDYKEDLEDLREFIRQIVEYLEKSPD